MEMYCFNCDKKVKVKKEKIKNKYCINNKNVIVDEYKYTCPNCNEELISETLDESLENIYLTYLKTYDLEIKDFKDIRNSLNLSQEEFSKILGWSKKTINRYENGQSYPQNEYLNVYIKLKNNKSEIINILNSNKNKLGDYYYKLLKKVKTFVDVKTINVFLYMLNDIPLYETQVMKHLFAVDFYNQKTIGHPLTCLKYAKAPYGPIIDNRENILNFLLQNNYLKLIYTNDDKPKFVTNKNVDLKLFEKEELEVMKYIKNKFKNKTSKELSDWSHNFEGWKKTKNGYIIDYNYATYLDL